MEPRSAGPPALIARLPGWTAGGRRAALIAVVLAAASEAATWIVAVAYGQWVGRSFDLRSFCIADCGWYSSIVDRGYDLVPSGHPAGDAANWAFFPMHPLLAGLVRHATGLGTQDSLLLTASLLLPVAIFAFVRLAEAHDIGLDPWLAGSLVAFNPYVVHAHAGYTEPLYLALSAGALLGLRRGRWMAAGILGSAAGATRLVGVFLVLPMITRLLRPPPPASPGARGDAGPLAPLLAIALVPLGLSLFGWYLYGRSGDLLAFAHAQVAAWDHIPDNPLVVLWGGLESPGRVRYFALVAALALLLSLYLCLGGMIGLGLMLGATTLLPLSAGLTSMPRYVFWQPAFLLALALLLRHRLARLVLLPILWGAALAMNAVWLYGDGFAI